MKTAELFVEVTIVGMGVAAVGTLAAGLRWGFDWIEVAGGQTWLALPALGGVYTLGIVFDRLYDWATDRVAGDRVLRAVYGSSEGQETALDRWHRYLRDRHLVLSAEGQAYAKERYDYGRSRIRIVRGTVVNALLAAVLSCVLGAARGAPDFFWLAAALSVLAASSAVALVRLTLTEYRMMKDVARVVRGEALESGERGRAGSSEPRSMSDGARVERGETLESGERGSG